MKKKKTRTRTKRLRSRVEERERGEGGEKNEGKKDIKEGCLKYYTTC